MWDHRGRRRCRSSVESDGSLEPLAVDRRVPREAPAHAEPGDPDPIGAEAPQRPGRSRDIGQDLFGRERAHQRREVGRLGAATAEEQVGGDSPVAFCRQALAHPQQLRADAATLVDDDDARPGPGILGEGDEVGERDRGHGIDLARFPGAVLGGGPGRRSAAREAPDGAEGEESTAMVSIPRPGRSSY